jgi:outer membrane protein assembly factor BamB
VVVGGKVYYCDAERVHCRDFATGEPATSRDGMLFRLDGGGTVEGRASDRGPIAFGEPRYTTTVAAGVLYARLGDASTGRANASRDRGNERLIGLDLARDGLLTFQARPDDGTWSFDGAPVAADGNVYIAMRNSDVTPRVYVASFDAATGRREWRTSIAAADTPAAGRGDEITHTLLTLVGDRLFINTNLGVVAALDAGDGRLCWLRRYDRTERNLLPPLPTHFDRDPAPCVYDRGTLFVAPADTPAVFALDADSGRALWSLYSLSDVTHLAGVASGTLVAAGHRLWAIDALTGRVRFVWPESEHAGLRGFGRAVVAGSEIFWPTREQVYVFDLTTGQPSRRPIEVSSITERGANLVAAEGRLLVAGPERMMAFGPRATAPSAPATDSENNEAVAERDRDATGPASGDT